MGPIARLGFCGGWTKMVLFTSSDKICGHEGPPFAFLQSSKISGRGLQHPLPTSLYNSSKNFLSLNTIFLLQIDKNIFHIISFFLLGALPFYKIIFKFSAKINIGEVTVRLEDKALVKSAQSE